MYMRYKNCLLWATLLCLFIWMYINANQVVLVNSSSVKPVETSEKFDSLEHCTSERIESYFQLRGSFMVFYNYVQASATFKCHETIAYTTHADYTFLGNVETLVDRWNGPVSIAVYAPGDDFAVALKSIAYLRHCQSPKIKKYVTFHIFFDVDHYPKESNITQPFHDGYDCDLPEPYISNKSNTYRIKHNLLYPINVARNIARVTAQTYYIFPSDIELYTVHNFPEQFLQMIRENPDYRNETRPRVFVLPIFEITANSNVPDTKTELQKMLKNKTAQTFHAKICLSCHKIPKYPQWMAAKETEHLHVFTSTSRTNRHQHWEPFYVGTHKEPLFDERLSWEGQSNKITQAYTMCLLNYEYMVLDNAFLIHKPGIKKFKEQLSKHPKVVGKTNAFIKKFIKPELKKLYGDRKGCSL